MIVDGQIQIFPALAALLAAARRALPGAIAGDAMSDPFDAAELLDVDMDQLARRLAFSRGSTGSSAPLRRL